MDRGRAMFLAEAPRQVPLSLRLQLLLGGIGQFGWMFGGFGSLFVWMFLPAVDLSFVTFRGPHKIVDGTITRVEETNYSEGGDEHTDGTPVYAVHYTYVDEAGGARAGVSYRTGAGSGAGQRVSVQYRAAAPGQARILGLRRAPFGPLVLLVLIFPLVGLGMVVYRLRTGWRAIRLLRDGGLGLAALQKKERTNTEINKKRLYKLTFAFQALDGIEYTVVAKTTEPENLEDEAQEKVLYDVRNPSFATMMDDIPGRPQADERGQFRGTRVGGWLSIVPGLVVAGNVLAAWRLWGG